MRLAAKATWHLRELRRHYRLLKRPEATRGLAAAIRKVPGLIAAGRSYTAPRPYPFLAAPGEAWVHAAPYWVVYQVEPPVILGVFFDQADIPGRWRDE